MSEISDAIQAKCLAFSDRIIKLNDYLLAQAVAAHVNYKKSKIQKKGKQTSSIIHQPSAISVAAVPVYLQSISNLCNQLLRSGTSIGANNAEACNAISKADFKSKSFIALKEARESLYWIELLHRNNYIDDKQYTSIYTDCEELVKILVTRCKRLNSEGDEAEKTSNLFLLPSSLKILFLLTSSFLLHIRPLAAQVERQFAVRYCLPEQNKQINIWQRK